MQSTDQEDSAASVTGTDSYETSAGVQRAIQLQILKLLSACIDMPAPNIAHLLLGFETGSGKHVSETTLQDPGMPLLLAPSVLLSCSFSLHLLSPLPFPSHPLSLSSSTTPLPHRCLRFTSHLPTLLPDPSGPWTLLQQLPLHPPPAGRAMLQGPIPAVFPQRPLCPYLTLPPEQPRLPACSAIPPALRPD